MSGLSLLGAAALAACVFIACHPLPDNFPHDGSGGTAQAGDGAQPTRGGHGGTGDTTDAAGEGGDARSAAGDSAEAGSGGDSMGGMAGEAGSTSSANGGGGSAAIPNEIPADAGAGPMPTDCDEQQATCTVISQPACEFMTFAGESRTLRCGETVTVGHAACGLCGPVTIKLYFDGRTCWQGAPDCLLSQFAGKFVYPHMP